MSARMARTDQLPGTRGDSSASMFRGRLAQTLVKPKTLAAITRRRRVLAEPDPRPLTPCIVPEPRPSCPRR